jgi:hypothetical protein
VKTYWARLKPSSGELGGHEQTCAATVPAVQQIANTRSLHRFLIGPPTGDATIRTSLLPHPTEVQRPASATSHSLGSRSSVRQRVIQHLEKSRTVQGVGMAWPSFHSTSCFICQRTGRSAEATHQGGLASVSALVQNVADVARAPIRRTGRHHDGHLPRAGSVEIDARECGANRVSHRSARRSEVQQP